LLTCARCSACADPVSARWHHKGVRTLATAVLAALATCPSVRPAVAEPVAPGPFEVLAFRRIPVTTATTTPSGLRFVVDKSAGLVFYRLPTPVRLARVRAEGRVDGALRVTATTQGAKGADDHAFKLGLVESGNRRPTTFERWFAPPWLKRLFALAPERGGIGGIRFLNVGVSSEQVGRSRTHPANDLLHERVVSAPDAGGRFAIDAVVSGGAPVLALWLASDGDDSGSSYEVVVQQIELHAEDGAVHVLPVTGAPAR
jgi:hypothetical protein